MKSHVPSCRAALEDVEGDVTELELKLDKVSKPGSGTESRVSPFPTGGNGALPDRPPAFAFPSAFCNSSVQFWDFCPHVDGLFAGLLRSLWHKLVVFPSVNPLLEGSLAQRKPHEIAGLVGSPVCHEMDGTPSGNLHEGSNLHA